MANQIAGPGQGLPPPQALYPRQLWTTPFTAPTNRVALQGGQALPIPAGTWIVQAQSDTSTSGIEWFNPVREEWHRLNQPDNPPWTYWGTTIRSDGFNFRVRNFTGAIYAASLTAGGANYVNGTTHAVASDGGSRWRVIVGGALGPVTIVKPGANYSIAPLVFVPAPPPPGIAAQGTAILTNGQVTGITWQSVGAGYTFPPPILIVPDPYDPVLLAAADPDSKMTTSDVIQNAQASCTLTGQGSVTGVMLRNAGIPLDTAPTLTITGQGSGATATVLPSTWLAPADDFILMQPASGP